LKINENSLAFLNFQHIYYKATINMKITTLQEDQAKFTFYNIRERLAANQLMEADQLITITHTSDEEAFTSWDVCLNSGSTKAVCEIKVRKLFTDSFQDFILEKHKYDALIEVCNRPKAKENNLQPLYINFFFDKIAVWNISKLKESDFVSVELRATSVDGCEDTKDKMVTYLKIEDAHIINYELDYNKLNVNAKTIFKYKYPNNKLNIN